MKRIKAAEDEEDRQKGAHTTNFSHFSIAPKERDFSSPLYYKTGKDERCSKSQNDKPKSYPLKLFSFSISFGFSWSLSHVYLSLFSRCERL